VITTIFFLLRPEEVIGDSSIVTEKSEDVGVETPAYKVDGVTGLGVPEFLRSSV
jgi:hypothetical protein